MPRTAANLKSAVAAFLHRDSGSFINGTFDVLLQAMNNARLYAERTVDFELAEVSVDVPSVSLTNGAALSTAVLHGTVTPVTVKKLKRAFLGLAAGGEMPIDIMSRGQWYYRLKKKFDMSYPADPTATIQTQQQPLACIQQGSTVYLTPANATVLGSSAPTLYLDVYKFLPDYGSTTITGSATSTTASKLVASAGAFITNGVTVGTIVSNTTNGTSAIVTAVDSATQLTLTADIFTSGNAYSINVLAETDFLLTNCFDWLMYRTVYELNFFLKEDERVALSDKMITDSWNSMMKWNTNMISSEVVDTTLD